MSDGGMVLSRKVQEAGYNIVSIIFDDWSSEEFEYLRHTCMVAFDKKKERSDVFKGGSIFYGVDME